MAAGFGATAHFTAEATAQVPTRDELEAITAPNQQTAQRLEIEGGIERSPCPLADPRFASVTVAVNEVSFNNLKGVSDSEMLPAWGAFRGTTQPVSAICEIRDAAATLLRNKGFLAAVQVPAQKIEDGVIRLEVLYARLVSVRARGETQGAEKKLEAYLGKLTEDEIFNRFDAERYLLLARDIPGYNVRMTLKPAGTGNVGDLIAEVAVLRRPYQVDLTLQNLAPSNIGPFGGQVRAQVHGLTGLADTTFVSLYSTVDFKEQQILQAGHSFSPGSEGLRLAGTFTYAWTEPSFERQPGVPSVEATTLVASLEASYPLVRSQGRNIWVEGGFNYIDQNVDFIGPLSEDKIRVVWLGASFDGIDTSRRIPRWQYSASAEIRTGLDIFDSSKTCFGPECVGVIPTSRLDASGSATLVRAAAEFEYSLSNRISAVLAPRAQYAFDPVLAYEEFTVGNYTIGRGYDPGTLTGDSGLGAKFELRGPRFNLSEKASLVAQPFVFTDWAKIWEKNDLGNADVVSVGGGFRGTLSDRVYFDAAVAVPLHDAPLTGRKGDVRFLFTLSTRLLPWEMN
jgi:hemolysin activation/secretion protein